jgi:hypothetical protein
MREGELSKLTELVLLLLHCLCSFAGHSVSLPWYLGAAAHSGCLWPGGGLRRRADTGRATKRCVMEQALGEGCQRVS